MILNLVDIKDPVLRKKAKLVKKFDKKLVTLVADMWETLKIQDDPEGIGLAAPQIGKSLQVFLVDHNGQEKTIINPKILKITKNKAKKKTKKEILEGCLSLQHYYGPISRNKSITIKYKDINGKEVKEKFDNFFAQIIEHEIDHLNGVLFVDRILEQGAPMYKFDGDEWEEVDLD